MEHSYLGILSYLRDSLLPKLAEEWGFKISLSALVSIIIACTETDAWLLLCITYFMLADFALGIMSAFKQNRFSIHGLHKGIVKIVTYYLSIIIVGSVGVAIVRATGVRTFIGDIFIAYLITTESLSIINHLDILGAPVPLLLRKIIKEFNSRIVIKAESVLNSAESVAIVPPSEGTRIEEDKHDTPVEDKKEDTNAHTTDK